MATGSPAKATRSEHDSLGPIEVPADAYYGVQTLRAAQNFSITGHAVSEFPHMVRGLALVKKAAAHANVEVGVLPKAIGDAISTACDEILAGKMHDQFITDQIQGGAGTSTNMNANEVIANRALELLGHVRGDYKHCHPLDHVNLSQSTNDAYPTACRVALYTQLAELLTAIQELKAACDAKAEEFAPVLKMGRTQLQDAVPMSLGQEFSTYGVMFADDMVRIREAQALLLEMNLGATAIGTGICSVEGYAPLAAKYLSQFTGAPFTTAANLVAATQDAGAFVQLSGVLKRYSTKLSKVCNDLRLLSSGPRTGLGEINLPKMQPGSSIMPGKVNPVIPEVVSQVCFQVIGNDVAISFCAEGGQMQLNPFEPLILACLVKNIDMLARASTTLSRKCVVGITANTETCRRNIDRSVGIVTALNPLLGYERSAEVAAEAMKTNRGVGEIAVERGYLTQAQLAELLSPDRMLRPGKC